MKMSMSSLKRLHQAEAFTKIEWKPEIVKYTSKKLKESETQLIEAQTQLKSQIHLYETKVLIHPYAKTLNSPVSAHLCIIYKFTACIIL